MLTFLEIVLAILAGLLVLGWILPKIFSVLMGRDRH